MRLLSNSAWNFAGGVIPAVAAIVTVPVVVSQLGAAHYGLLTLITAIVGYFSLLDINATTGSVKYLAEFRSRNDDGRIAQVFSLGIGLYLLVGLVGGVAIAVFADPLATRVFNVPPALHDTAVGALQFGGAAFFFGQLQMYLLSVPQALHRYDLSARNEAVFGSLASVSTVLIVLAGGGLVEIMATRAAIAAANAAVLAHTTLQLLPRLRAAWPGRDVWRGMLGFSAFSYLSRFSSTTYANADKLLIGAYVDMKALAMYAVPFLLANRLFALSFRLGQVMLPEASRLHALGERSELRRKYLDGARLLLFVNACITVLLIVLGRELLHHWAGPAFGAQATLILVLVTTAVLVDSFTNLPSLVNDGLGKPANTGVFAFVRALVGMGAAWLAVQSHGIVGVAWAQLGVSLVMSGGFLVWVHRQVLPARLSEYLQHAVAPCVLPWAAALLVGLNAQVREPLPLGSAALLALATALALAAWGWWVVLRAPQRASVSALLRQRLRPRGA